MDQIFLFSKKVACSLTLKCAHCKQKEGEFCEVVIRNGETSAGTVVQVHVGCYPEFSKNYLVTDFAQSRGGYSMHDPWENYNPFDEEDPAVLVDSDGNRVEEDEDPWGFPDPFSDWSSSLWDRSVNSRGHIVMDAPVWWPLVPALDALQVPPTDQLIDQLTKLSISDIQRASALRAKGLTPLEVINELQLLFPGTATQQLCQIAGFIDYADAKRD